MENNTNNLVFTKTGTTLPAIQIVLTENIIIYCESGKMSWMTSNVKMDTKTKGFSKIFSRLLLRESFFINEFTLEEGGKGVLAFTPSLPGNIVNYKLSSETPNIIAQKGSLICAENDVDTKISFQAGIFKGLFGGEGFLMEKFSGVGNLFLEIAGSIIKKELNEGEVLYVDQGNIAAFEDTVKYKLTIVRGIINWFFSSEGMFICKLTGPGTVWIQSLPASQLSTRLKQVYKKRSLGCCGFIVILIIIFYLLSNMFSM